MSRAAASLLATALITVLVLGAGLVAATRSSSASLASQSVDTPSGWTNLTSSLAPPAMAGAMMAYSPNAHRFVLFGGWDGVHGLNETWVFDPTNRTWTLLHPATSPMPRGDEMFVFDNRSDLFVLFGGWYEFPNETYMRLSDTWTFSLATDAWTERHPSASPSPRSDSEVAYDSAADAVLLVGGFSGTTYLGDVWAYFPGNDTWWPRPAAVQPSPRADGRMVYVADQNRFILFGGNDYSGPNFSFHHLADTWSYGWAAEGWTLLSTDTAPSARDYPVFAVDPESGLALLTSGYGNRTILNDIWGFNLTTDTWSNLTPALSPPARFAGAGGFDPTDNVFVLFSGAGNNGLLADTWYYRDTPTQPAPMALPWVAILITLTAGAAVIATVALRVSRKRRTR